MKRIVTILVFFLSLNFSVLGQSITIEIKEALSVIGKDIVSVKTWAKSKGYVSQPAKVSDFLEFKMITQFGDKKLSIGLKNQYVSAISWGEHIVFASNLRVDAELLEGYAMKPQVDSRMLVFESLNDALLISLITQPWINTVMVTVGKSSKKPLSNSISKATSKRNTTFSELNSINSIQRLYKIYGRENIQKLKEGEYLESPDLQCFILYPGTNDEVFVYSQNDTIIRFDFEKRLSGWVLPMRIKIGMPIESIISLNQKDFDIFGFEWDNGGEVVNWKGGKLTASKILPKFSVGSNVDQKRYVKITGENIFNTGQKDLKGIELIVSRIHIIK